MRRYIIDCDPTFVVAGIHEFGSADLLEFADTSGIARPFTRRRQCRQQHGSQDGDDGDYNQKLDQCK